MDAFRFRLKYIVTALLLTVWYSGPLAAQSANPPANMDALMQALRNAGENDWKGAEDRVWAAWSKSGSAAMDLLLKRGQDAIKAEQYDVAIEHLTALIDHAPDFTEAYDVRALAYYRSGLYGPALQDIARVLDENPQHFGALAGLGAILEELGQPEKALEVYRRVLEIHPHKPDVLKAVGRLEKVVEGEAL